LDRAEPGLYTVTFSGSPGGTRVNAMINPSPLDGIRLVLYNVMRKLITIIEEEP
jgi:hypothetical protein